MFTVVAVIVLLMLGMALLAAEIFVIPGFGVVGVLGIACTLGAGAVAFTQLGAAWGMGALGGGIVLSGGMAAALGRSRTGRGMILRDSQRAARSGDATLAQLAGVLGEAVTPLRPSGAARLGGRVVDVITDGIYVEAGARVRVAKVEGSRVVVEPASS